MILNSPYVSGSLTVTGNIIASGSITLSGSVASASYAASATSASYALNATSASYALNATTASYAVSATTASFANAFTVAGNLTAQTLVVQTITSSVDYVTGSTQFGSLLTNTHVFSGSITMNPGGLFVSSSGRVGIGTTNPTQILNVYSPASSDQAYLIMAQTSGAAALFTARTTVTSTYLGTENSSAGSTINGTLANASFLANQSATALQLGTNNNIRLTITNSGSVGIGTTNPGAQLQVAGTVEANGSLYRAVFGTTVQDADMTGLTGGNGSEVQIQAPSITRGAYLTLGGGMNFGEAMGGIAFYNSNNVDGKRCRAFIVGGQEGATAGEQGSYLSFGTVDNTGTVPSEKIRVTRGGFVGIGTSNPGQKFEVVGGEIKAGRVDSSNEGGQVSFARASDNNTSWYIDAYGSSTSPSLRFVDVDNSSVRMTLTGSYMGIGTSSPSNPLHLVNANHYQFKIQDSAASMLFGADDSTMIGIEMANSAGATWFIGPHDPGTSGIQDRLTIGRLSGTWSYPAKFSSGGNLTILGTLTQNASDIRLKDNIENIPNALNKILSLNGFIFNWNELASNLGPYSTDTKQVGVSAQEIQSVLPEAVFLAPFDVDSFDDNKSKSGENYLTVQYDKIIPLLIEGIKELKAQNDNLQSQINELKNQ